VIDNKYKINERKNNQDGSKFHSFRQRKKIQRKWTKEKIESPDCDIYVEKILVKYFIYELKDTTVATSMN